MVNGNKHNHRPYSMFTNNNQNNHDNNREGHRGAEGPLHGDYDFNVEMKIHNIILNKTSNVTVKQSDFGRGTIAGPSSHSTYSTR